MPRPPSSFTVKEGPVSIPIYHSAAKGYHIYCVAWTAAGKRQRKRFSDPQKARDFATDLARNIHAGRSDVPALTREQTAEYLEAKQLAGSASLIDLARRHARGLRASRPRDTTNAIADFLAAKREAPRRRPLNPEYLRNLSTRLDAFARRFPVPLADLHADEIQSWINTLPGSLRTKNNHLADVRMLIHHAKRQRWLPSDFDELNRVTLDRAGPGKIQPYTPEEAATLLTHAQKNDLRWLPWLPLRLFSGLRTTESLRLTPRHLHSTGWIACDEAITKTELRRLIPIVPNLATWLRDYPPGDAISPVPNLASLAPRLTEFIQAAGVQPRHNGFRDSFASYRMAALGDAAKVAEETGHSPAQLRRSYREIRLPDARIITPPLARRYFRLLPK